MELASRPFLRPLAGKSKIQRVELLMLYSQSHVDLLALAKGQKAQRASQLMIIRQQRPSLGYEQ